MTELGKVTQMFYGLPTAEVPLGLYELPRGSDTAHTYRMGHPLRNAS